MPPKRKNIGRPTPQARKKRTSRASEADEPRDARLSTVLARTAQTRWSETAETREAILETVPEFTMLKNHFNKQNENTNTFSL
jgi:hypothetical protein